MNFVIDAKLRPNMIVVTTDITVYQKPGKRGKDWFDEVMAEAEKVHLQLKNSILQLDSKNSIRWLFH